MTGILEQAREIIAKSHGCFCGCEKSSACACLQDATSILALADPSARIAALGAQLAEAVSALKPFASVGRIIDGPFGPALFAKDDQAFKNGCAWRENGEDKFLTWGDFRRAAGVCARSEQEGK